MTIPEFRIKLKQAFDQAEQGTPVTITRSGKVFELRKVAD